MNATLCFINPKETLSKVQIRFSAELYRKMQFKRVVIEFINEKIHIREALQMDDGLKVCSNKWQYHVGIYNKKGQHFIGKWDVRQEGESFVLYKRTGELDQED